MTGCRNLTLAIELLQGGVADTESVAEAAYLPQSTVYQLLSALDGEGHGAMVMPFVCPALNRDTVNGG